MARRPQVWAESPEEDTRPLGSVRFADPSTAAMTGRIHAAPQPHGANESGAQYGIRSVTPEHVPWRDYTGGREDEQWSAMRRKRGVHDDQE